MIMDLWQPCIVVTMATAAYISLCSVASSATDPKVRTSTWTRLRQQSLNSSSNTSRQMSAPSALACCALCSSDPECLQVTFVLESGEGHCHFTTPGSGVEGGVTYSKVVHCPAGWVQIRHVCLWLGATLASHAQAVSGCSNEGGKLFCPANPDELLALWEFLYSPELPPIPSVYEGYHFLWLGASDKMAEGSWTCPDGGAAMLGGRWAPGDPNGNATESAMLARFRGGDDGFIDFDEGTNFTYSYLCQRPPE